MTLEIWHLISGVIMVAASTWVGMMIRSRWLEQRISGKPTMQPGVIYRWIMSDKCDEIVLQDARLVSTKGRKVVFITRDGKEMVWWSNLEWKNKTGVVDVEATLEETGIDLTKNIDRPKKPFFIKRWWQAWLRRRFARYQEEWK